MVYYGICSIGAELVCVEDTLTTWGYAAQCRALTDRCLLRKIIRNPIGCIRSETLGKKVSVDTAEGGRRHIPSEHRAWETQSCHGGFSAPGLGGKQKMRRKLENMMVTREAMVTPWKNLVDTSVTEDCRIWTDGSCLGPRWRRTARSGAGILYAKRKTAR